MYTNEKDSTFNEITAESITTGSITATTGEIETLTSTTGNIETVNSDLVDTFNISSANTNFTNMYANNAQIEKIDLRQELYLNDPDKIFPVSGRIDISTNLDFGNNIFLNSVGGIGDEWVFSSAPNGNLYFIHNDVAFTDPLELPSRIVLSLDQTDGLNTTVNLPQGLPGTGSGNFVRIFGNQLYEDSSCVAEKENIIPNVIDFSAAIETLPSLKKYNFTGQTEDLFGYIAEEMSAVHPEFCTYTDSKCQCLCSHEEGGCNCNDCKAADPPELSGINKDLLLFACIQWIQNHL